MAIPKGFVRVHEGTVRHGDYIVSKDGGYESYAKGVVGHTISESDSYYVYCEPPISYTAALREKVRSYFPDSDSRTTNNFIKAVCRLNGAKNRRGM